MSDEPDVLTGEFDVVGLPEIDGATWTITARPGPTPEWPEDWWSWDQSTHGYWLTLTVGSDEWTLPTRTELIDNGIMDTGYQLQVLRLADVRGEVAQTTPIHPVPKAL